jgi:glycosyltransferase involved in cell wall biosynthesis
VHNVCREYTATAVAIARRRKVPLVLTPLPHPGQIFSGASAADFESYRQADGIVAMTALGKRWYESLGVASERIAVVGAGAAVKANGDGAAFRARHGIAGPIVLFVGRQEPYKGYLAMLAAGTEVWRKHPETHFVLVGQKGWSSRLRDPLARYEDRRIVDLKVVSDQEKADAYAACDVFCMPSTHETLGLTYLEAWSYGKPVIGGDIPPLREVIRDGVDGILVAQRPAAIAMAINFLLDRPTTAREMGMAGRRKVEEQYNWQMVVDKLEGFYRQLC